LCPPQDAARRGARVCGLGTVVVPLALGALAACGEPERATIVALPGCGLEGGVLSNLRVQTRGDFPAGAATQVLVSDGAVLFSDSMGPVDGITVEGLFGEEVAAVGRTARLRPTGQIPVYFGAVDHLCEVGRSVVPFRHPGAMAVAPLGDVLIVGGRDAGGDLVDDIVHVADETGTPVVAASLPDRATGQSVHAVGPREFLVVGGATHNEALSEVVRVEVTPEGDVAVSNRIPIGLEGEHGRAHHSAATMLDGTILVTGGCTQVTNGACVQSEDALLASSMRIDVAVDPPTFRAAPPLPSARQGHDLHVARDGVAFAIGGRGPEGISRLEVHTLALGDSQWEPFGPPLTSELPSTALIEGSTVLEGGLVLLAMNDGTLRWMNEDTTAAWEGWCDPAEPDSPCFANQAARPPGRRPLLALPGERIVADHFLLPVGGLGQTGADAIDLALPTAASGELPPRQRTGGLMVPLADGSALVVGGLEPFSQTPLLPLALRLRPALDGPDERIPTIDGTQPGGLVALHLERVQVDGNAIALSSAQPAVGFPSVRAHVRGFRSSSFRFEVTFTAQDPAYPHVILQQGAFEGLSVRFGAEVIRGYSRNAAGNVIDFSCGQVPPGFWQDDVAQVLEVTVHPDSFTVSQGETTLARCPVPDLDRPVSIGIGVSGSGTITASGLRLTRL